MLNQAYDVAAVPAVASEALAFHRALEGYAPTPLHDLGGGVWLKDESARLGLPAFKVLGASWAVERALRHDPSIRMLVAASAGNHGRAVAHVARVRGLACRVYLPARAVQARREAIAGEGAEVVMVDGPYEEAVAQAASDGLDPGCFELADVGLSGPAEWVIDGYATLFAELPTDFIGGAGAGRRGLAGRGGGALGRCRGRAGDRGRAGRRRVPDGVAARG